MKKFLSFIFKTIIKTCILLMFIFFILVMYIYITSYANETSIDDTFAYLKSIGTDLLYSLNFNLPSNDQVPTSITPIIASDGKYRYYYEQLDDNAKIMYSALENNIDHLKEDNYVIDFSTQFNALLNESSGKYELNKSFQSALDAFVYDHPELFYIDLTKISLIINYTSFASKTTYKVSFKPENNSNYLIDGFTSAAQVDQAIATLENIKQNILSTIDANSSDYEKALVVHDYLVKNLEYDTEEANPNTRNIYGALVDNVVVCEGYAKAFKYILDSLDIKCILVSGTATNSSYETDEHMWNYIYLDDNWYGVDVTWDDPIIIGGGNKKIIRRDYFCKKASSFNSGHISNGKISENGMLFNLPDLCTTNYK